MLMVIFKQNKNFVLKKTTTCKQNVLKLTKTELKI